MTLSAGSAPVVGSAARLGIDTNSTVGVLYDFQSENLVANASILDLSGMRGTRSHPSERTAPGTIVVGGTIRMFPSKAELAALLQWILGGTPSGSGPTTYPLADIDPPTRNIWVYRGNFAQTAGGLFKYAGCVVSRATFSGGENGPIELDLDIVAKTETVVAANDSSATTFIALSEPLGTPFTFSGSTVTMQSTAREVRQFSLTIDNGIEVQFNNSLTATRILWTDRIVGYSCDVPWGKNEDLYLQSYLGAAATHAVTNGTDTLTWALAALQVPPIGPAIGAKTEPRLQIAGTARTSSTTKELITTL